MSIGVHRTKPLPHPHERTADWAEVPPPCVLDWTEELVAADRACCCSAKPSVTVVLPAHDLDSGPTTLLLCGHHYRANQRALRAKRAEAYDRDGRRVTDEHWPLA